MDERKSLRSILDKEYDITPQAGDIWRRTLLGQTGLLVDVYYLILLTKHSGNPAFPYEYRMLPLTPHLDKQVRFQYETPLNRWGQWKKVA